MTKTQNLILPFDAIQREIFELQKAVFFFNHIDFIDFLCG